MCGRGDPQPRCFKLFSLTATAAAPKALPEILLNLFFAAAILRGNAASKNALMETLRGWVRFRPF